MPKQGCEKEYPSGPGDLSPRIYLERNSFEGQPKKRGRNPTVGGSNPPPATVRRLRRRTERRAFRNHRSTAFLLSSSTRLSACWHANALQAIPLRMVKQVVYAGCV